MTSESRLTSDMIASTASPPATRAAFAFSITTPRALARAMMLSDSSTGASKTCSHRIILDAMVARLGKARALASLSLSDAVLNERTGKLR